jgi:predicted ATPase
MAARMTKLTLKGFKTVRELVDFEPRDLNILIGANGAGKSNFLSFFRMLSWMLVPPGGLQEYVGREGAASSLLFDGPERTHEIEAELTLMTETGENQYAFRLVFAARDTLIFTHERYRFSRKGGPQRSWKEFEAGHRESGLIAPADDDTTAKVIHGLLQKIISHQFHNTSPTARIRTKWDVEENRWLKEDGGNLAPFLFRLRESESDCYQRIVEIIRLILPFFANFELEPEYGRLLLSWRERNSDRVFNASQAGDGMLRIMALVSLLGQPERDLPPVLLLDEPELGLHPYAIEIVGGMLRSASEYSQIFVATQSATFVEAFKPEDVVVVDRDGRESRFRRLRGADLGEWLDEYTLGELWRKNVLGGGPTR